MPPKKTKIPKSKKITKSRKTQSQRQQTNIKINVGSGGSYTQQQPKPAYNSSGYNVYQLLNPYTRQELGVPMANNAYAPTAISSALAPVGSGGTATIAQNSSNIAKIPSALDELLKDIPLSKGYTDKAYDTDIEHWNLMNTIREKNQERIIKEFENENTPKYKPNIQFDNGVQKFLSNYATEEEIKNFGPMTDQNLYNFVKRKIVELPIMEQINESNPYVNEFYSLEENRPQWDTSYRKDKDDGSDYSTVTNYDPDEYKYAVV